MKTSIWDSGVRSFRAAWKNYIRGRVVSEHAKRSITNAIGACTAYGSRDDEEVPAADDKSLNKLKLQGMTLTLNQVHSLVTEPLKQPAEENLAGEKVSEKMTSATVIGGEMWRFQHQDDDDSIEVRA